MAQNRIPFTLLALIILTYLAVAGLYAVRTPDWQTPDEPAHYNYTRQLVENGKVPMIESGDWDQAYLGELTSNRFAPETLANLDAVQYEDHQPPFYYMLAAPIYALTNGNLTALRLLSVLIGLIIIVSAYGIGRAIYPDRPQIGLGAAAFVAFLPQHVAFLAAANNDALGWALVALILWGTVLYLKPHPPAPSPIHREGEGNNAFKSPLHWLERGFRGEVKIWHLGLLVGIGFITKATTYFMAGIVMVAILLHYLSLRPSPLRWGGDGGGDWLRQLVREVGLLLLPALILGGVWWLHNMDVYGVPDFLGLRAHDAVVIGQPRTADFIAANGWSAYLDKAARETFQSFFSQAGWMALPLQGIYYVVFGAFLLFALAGLFLVPFNKLIGRTPPQPLPNMRRDQDKPDFSPSLSSGRGLGGGVSGYLRSIWIILILTIALSILAYLYYNSEFLQLQGRYMYPLLIPLGIILALGLDSWRRILKLAWWLVPLVFFALALFDVWLLWRVIVPNLS